jgi:hypothetical protein
MFGIKDIPSDNHIRKILDTITPKCFKMIYEKILLKIKSLGILKRFTFCKEYLLVALDGTYYHSSKNISCKCCQKRVDKENGEIHYYHSVITPTIVHPDNKKVIPLMQEFIDNNDGMNKQDCEINGSKRWIDTFENTTDKKLIILGDDLYSRELSKTLCSLNILAFLFHTVQELEDKSYQELKKEIGSREKFFGGINFLTTMFNFRSFNHMIEFILKSRQTNENINMEPYIM